MPKTGTGFSGQQMHYSVGAIIEVGGKYLLIDRDMEPLGFAGIAGHINENESPEEALIRKVEEESSLKVDKFHLVFEEEVPWNWCRVGVKTHYWYLFRCKVAGDPQNNPLASKTIGWYTPDEMKKLKWEPVWKYWFEKLGVL